KVVLGDDPVMSLGIERIVDRRASPGTQLQIFADDRIAAAISKNIIIATNQFTERVQRTIFDPRQCCRSIDVPKGDHRVPAFKPQHFSFQQLVEYPDTTALDYQISRGRLFQRPQHTGGTFRGIDPDACPGWRADIAMRLTLVSVGLV